MASCCGKTMWNACKHHQDEYNGKGWVFTQTWRKNTPFDTLTLHISPACDVHCIISDNGLSVSFEVYPFSLIFKILYVYGFCFSQCLSALSVFSFKKQQQQCCPCCCATVCSVAAVVVPASWQRADLSPAALVGDVSSPSSRCQLSSSSSPSQGSSKGG